MATASSRLCWSPGSVATLLATPACLRVQAEIDRALATQRAELELKWAEAQVVSMSNMREQLQARFDVQLAETQRALKAEYSNKLADAMYEKNAILEHLEVNRKELVRQIRELSAREVALPCPAPAPAAAAPDGSPAVLEEVMREHLAAMRAQLKGDIQVRRRRSCSLAPHGCRTNAVLGAPMA